MTGQRGARDLRAEIRAEYLNYERDWTRPGFRAMAVYRFGVWAKELELRGPAGKLITRLLDILYIVGHRYVRNHYGIELYRSARIGKNVKFPHQGGIVIHHYAEIGDNCQIQHGVTLGSAGRGIVRGEAPRLEANVTVGPGVVILGRVTIGEGARISPNVVIFTDIPAGATVVANSPRVIYAPGTRKRSEMSASASDES